MIFARRLLAPVVKRRWNWGYEKEKKEKRIEKMLESKARLTGAPFRSERTSEVLQ
jgi:hypothetical protein